MKGVIVVVLLVGCAIPDAAAPGRIHYSITSLMAEETIIGTVEYIDAAGAPVTLEQVDVRSGLFLTGPVITTGSIARVNITDPHPDPFFVPEIGCCVIYGENWRELARGINQAEYCVP